MIRYACLKCGYIYEPEKGDPTQDVAPGTPGKDLPESWVCPKCKAKQSHFAILQEDD